jgi:hypothetical protein
MNSGHGCTLADLWPFKTPHTDPVSVDPCPSVPEISIARIIQTNDPQAVKRSHRTLQAEARCSDDNRSFHHISRQFMTFDDLATFGIVDSLAFNIEASSWGVLTSKGESK